MFFETSFIILILIGIGLWFWQSCARAKELATLTSQKACADFNLQFLDGTTNFSHFSFKRDKSGKLAFIRHYQFEYFDGESRKRGRATVFKNQVEIIFEKFENRNGENHATDNGAHGNVIPFRKK